MYGVREYIDRYSNTQVSIVHDMHVLFKPRRQCNSHRASYLYLATSTWQPIFGGSLVDNKCCHETQGLFNAEYSIDAQISYSERINTRPTIFEWQNA